jgi:hypothetical protein
MSAVVEIARRIVSVKIRSARDAKKPPQSTAKSTHPQDKKYWNINYLITGWGAWIRTREWRNQNPLPYHLATPHHAAQIPPHGARTIAARSDAINAFRPLRPWPLRLTEGAFHPKLPP